MGRYQQWLHYRQVELLLQEELAQLEDEIARLLTAMQSQEAVTCLSQNPIIAALATTLVDHEPAALTALAELEQSSVETPALPTITAPLSITPAPDEQSASGIAPPVTISPALRSWGDLPDFYGATPDAGPDSSSPAFSPQSPPLPHAEIVLLPEDMNTFFDQHTQTDPQLDLPWWLRSIMTDSEGSQINGPIDPQSIRTNRLVQRWLERWSQPPQAPRDPGENIP